MFSVELGQCLSEHSYCTGQSKSSLTRMKGYNHKYCFEKKLHVYQKFLLGDQKYSIHLILFVSLSYIFCSLMGLVLIVQYTV